MQYLIISHPIRWIFILHAVVGFVAIFSFLIPLLSKKGGKLHVKSGWVYLYAMIFVGLTSYAITPWRMWGDPSRTQSSMNSAAFLFFIATFALNSLWYGLCALKEKTRTTVSRAPKHVIPPVLLILSAVVVQAMGVQNGNPLMIGFPFLGLYSASMQLRYWLNVPQTKMHWWYAHMNGMYVACIATVTGFLVTAVPRLLPLPFLSSPIVWVGVSVVMGVILSRWVRSYEIKFGDR